jgi:hypothetical protein
MLAINPLKIPGKVILLKDSFRTAQYTLSISAVKASLLMLFVPKSIQCKLHGYTVEFLNGNTGGT